MLKNTGHEPGHGSHDRPGVSLSAALVVLVLFILLSVLFHYRVFAEHILIAPDNDALRQNYPIRHLYSYALRTFQFPLWNPYMFAGQPFMAEIQNGVLYPLNILMYSTLSPPNAYNLSYVLHFALAGFFTWLYLRGIGLGGLAAFAGGIVFGFSGFLVANKDHTAIVNSSVYVPLIMYLLQRLKEQATLRLSLVLSLVVAVQIFAGSMQACLYGYIVSGMFIVFYSSRKLLGLDGGGLIEFLAASAGAFLAGFLIASPQIAASMELSGFSWLGHASVYRGYAYFSLYHLYASTLPSLFSPHLFSGWGPSDASSITLGLLPVVFAPVSAAVLIRRNHNAFFWAMVAVVGLLLSLGSDTPLNRLMYDVPFYNMFRAHGRNLLEFSLAVAVLFSLGLDAVLHDEKTSRRCLIGVIVALGLVFFAFLVAAGLSGFLPLDGLVGYLKSAGFRRPEFIANALRLSYPPVIAALAASAAYAVWSLICLRFGGRFLVLALLLFLVSLEAFHIGSYRNLSGPSLSEARDLCTPEPYSELLDEAGGPFRIANIFAIDSPLRSNPSANLFCRVGSVNSYDPLVLDGYARLLYLWRDGTYTHMWDDIVRNNVVLGMLGVKYLKVSADSGFKALKIEANENMPIREKVDIPGWRPYNAEELPAGAFRLGPRGEALSGVVSLEPAEYMVSIRLRAAARGADGRVLVNLLSASSVKTGELLHIIPDRIGEEYGVFHRVFRVRRQDVYMLQVYSLSNKPVEFEGVVLQRLNNYAPLYLPGYVPSGTGDAVYEKIKDDGSFALFLNRNVLPMAWPVTELIEAGDMEDMIMRLYSLDVNPANQAMLSASDLEKIDERMFSRGEVRHLRHGLNSSAFETRFEDRGFVVASEQYYPGWKAYLDGKETEVYRANGILRGVVVPSGEHVLEFRYQPAMILLLMGVGLLAALSAVVMIIRGGGREAPDETDELEE